MRKTILLGLVFGGLIGSRGTGHADGCFVFRWNKDIDISEPTQKAIILHDRGQEDLVLQVKYAGPAEEFGWLVPVPRLPKVSKGSMDCFYELSQMTQKESGVGMPQHASQSADNGMREEQEPVKVVKIETVGAYEVAILAAGDATKLTEWLDANGFDFPKEKRDVLDAYVKKQWYFVVIKINPEKTGFTLRQGSPRTSDAKKNISPATRKQLANGELHPLVISFASEKCVFPLAISAINGKPSEVSLYVLSAEPLMSRTIYDKQFAAYAKQQKEWVEHAADRRKAREEQIKKIDAMRDNRTMSFRRGANANFARHFGDDDPADPQPSLSTMRELSGMPRPFNDADGNGTDDLPYEPLLLSMEAKSKDLAACAKELPRLAGKSWWLTKQVQVFAPEEMRDLEFEPAIPLLTDLARTTEGAAQAFSCLRQFGARAVPTVLAGMKSSEPEQRRLACLAAGEMKGASLAPAAARLLDDENARTRAAACYAIGNNWDDALAPRLVEKLSDPDGNVRRAAAEALRQHPDESRTATYRKLLESDGVGAEQVVQMADFQSYSRAQLIHFLSSTNLPVVSTAFVRLRYSLTLDEVAPLLANPQPMVRMMGLGELMRMSSKPAMDRMVAMLHDSNEGVRWRVRADLRGLTGQKLGADPAAYEKWWQQNRETFTPPPPRERRGVPPFREALSQ